MQIFDYHVLCLRWLQDIALKKLLVYDRGVDAYTVADCLRHRTSNGGKGRKKQRPINTLTGLNKITSHHMENTEAGLKGLYIREITLKI